MRKGLTEKARTFNQKAVDIKSTIASLNEQIGKLGVELDVWLSDGYVLECSMWEYDGDDRRTRSISRLGYDCIEGKWQLLVEKLTQVVFQDREDGPEKTETQNPTRTPLLRAPISIQQRALEKMPQLLKEFEKRVEEATRIASEAQNLVSEP